MSKKKSFKGLILGIAIVLLVFIIAGLVGYSYLSNEIDGNRGKEVVSATVIIEEGSGPLTMGRALQAEGIIKQPQIFRYYVSSKNLAGSLQAGEFDFTSDMSYDEIITVLQTVKVRESTRVTIPEGKSLIQIAQIMQDAGLCTADEFIATANDTAILSQYNFWQHVTENENAFMTAEGYVFPDTYDFFNDDTVENMVKTFYANFDAKITADMLSRCDELGMNFNDVVILASIIQEEAGDEVESYRVSAVFHNRLDINMMLQSNASSYVQNDADNNYVWNTIAPYYGGWDNIPAAIRTAYDTYAVTGLPAGPISNPGITSIMAALYPDEGYMAEGYLFFVTDANTGEYYYAKTADEHYVNCVKAGWA